MNRQALAVAAAALIGFGAGAGTLAAVDTEPAPKPKTVIVNRCQEGEVPTHGTCLRVGTPPESAAAERKVLRLRTPLKSAPLRSSGIRVSNHGVSFVAGFEGFSSCPYWDAYGHVATRGFGETDFSDTFGHRCVTYSFALNNLRRLLDQNYCPVIGRIGGRFNQNQIDAMCSASYNLGPGIILTLASSFRAHNCSPLLAYSHAGGVFLPGLYRRRVAECHLFNSGHPPAPPAPPETHAQKVARWHRELKAHEHILGDVRSRQVVLRRVLLQYGCVRRRDHHQVLGKTCTRWFKEGQSNSRYGQRQDAIIKSFHRKGIY